MQGIQIEETKCYLEDLVLRGSFLEHDSAELCICEAQMSGEGWNAIIHDPTLELVE